jgi:hypothetical protein
MKKIFLPISLLSILIISCDIRKHDNQQKVSATEKKEIKAPTTVVVIDTTFDFGKLNEGEIVEYNYRFKNTGNKPLIIEEAIASCGCTVPEKPDHAIAPGEMGFIKVKFNSDHRPGETHKSITVTSNAVPEFPTLYLKGTVIGKTNE